MRYLIETLIVGLLIFLLHLFAIRPVVYYFLPDLLFGWSAGVLIPAAFLLIRQIRYPTRTRIKSYPVRILIMVMLVSTVEFSWAGFQQVRNSVPDQVHVKHYRFLVDDKGIILGTGPQTDIRLINRFAAKKHLAFKRLGKNEYIAWNISHSRKVLVNDIDLMTIPLKDGDRIRIANSSRLAEFLFTENDGEFFLEGHNLGISLSFYWRDLPKDKKRVLLFTNRDPAENQLPSDSLFSFKMNEFSILTLPVQAGAKHRESISDQIAEIIRIDGRYYIRYASREARAMRSVMVRQKGTDTFRELQDFGKIMQFDSEYEITVGYTSYKLTGSSDAGYLVFEEDDGFNYREIIEGEPLLFQGEEPALFQPGTHLPLPANHQEIQLFQHACTESGEGDRSFFFLPMTNRNNLCLQASTTDSAFSTAGNLEESDGINLHAEAAGQGVESTIWREGEPLRLNISDYGRISYQWISADNIVSPVYYRWSVYYLAFFVVFIFWLMGGTQIQGMNLLLIANFIIQMGLIILFKLGYHEPGNFRWHYYIQTQLKGATIGCLATLVFWAFRNYNNRLWDLIRFRICKKGFESGNWLKKLASNVVTEYKWILVCSSLLALQATLGDETGIRIPLLDKVQMIDLMKLLYILNGAAIVGYLTAHMTEQIDRDKIIKEPSPQTLFFWTGRFFIALVPIIILMGFIRDLSQMIIFSIVIVQVLVMFHQSFSNFLMRFMLVLGVLIACLIVGKNLDPTAGERFAVFFNPWSVEGSSSSAQYISNLWSLIEAGREGVTLKGTLPSLPPGARDDFIMTLHAVLFGGKGIFIMLFSWFLLFSQALLLSTHFFYNANISEPPVFFKAPVCRLQYSSMQFFLTGVLFIHFFFSVANMTGIFPVVGQPMVFVSASGMNILLLGFGFLALILFSAVPGKVIKERINA